LLENLDAKLLIINGDATRRERITKARETLEKRLYLLESGPTGNGPASAVIANSTGCSSVYASTFPFNPYNDPWVNSLFQDAPAVAKGLFEGLAASVTDDIKALRIAGLELDDAYDPAVHDKYFKTFAWSDFTPAELALLPAVISMGGDGATYDIGFGALSRLLTTQTPVKVVVLNTGAYSNTGGQASTASLTGQDSDLARFGSAHHGKQEDRKELGLIASFHPNVFVVQASTALQGHFLKSVMAYLNHTSSPAVLDIYTPCQGEHGIADAAASQRSRLAVECRMSPVFVHDPRVNVALHGRFNLEGNPDLDKDWTKTSIEYVEDGATKLMEVALTPAYFAKDETRFKKQFRKLPADADAILIEDYVALPVSERAGKTPFVYSTDHEKRLIKEEVSSTIVHLVEERRKNWRTLQYLAGRQVEKLDADHKAELDAMQQRYQEAVTTKESTLDIIARAMSELAASSNAPANGSLSAALAPFGGGAAPAPAAAPAKATNGSGAGVPFLRDEDMAKCTNCKTCYQQVSELFELTKIVVDGAPKDVAHTIPGVLAKLKITPELKARVARVAANCDAEIIR